MPDVPADEPASMPGPHEPMFGDLERLVELAAEIERHRYLLRSATEDYRWRLARRVADLDPDHRAMQLAQRNEQIEAELMAALERWEQLGQL